MNLFETTAQAAEAAGPGPDAGLINLIMLGGFVIIFYFIQILLNFTLIEIEFLHKYNWEVI